jgi:hypothetical protein
MELLTFPAPFTPEADDLLLDTLQRHDEYEDRLNAAAQVIYSAKALLLLRMGIQLVPWGLLGQQAQATYIAQVRALVEGE